MVADNVIEAHGLTKRYGEVQAIQNIDFEVHPASTIR
jgi:ABC-type multidrug transport system ATPase subunit